MNFSESATNVIANAIDFAREAHFEYITPELILLEMLDDDGILYALDECGCNVEMLASMLQNYLDEYMDRVDDIKEPAFSMGTNQLITLAGQSALSSGNSSVGLRHLIHAMWTLENSYAVYFMEQQGLNEAELLKVMTYVEEDIKRNDDTEVCHFGQDSENSLSGTKLYAPCLNDTLKDANPLIGRKDELDRTIQILCRKEKNNPLHIGEPGVGKTAITYGLVQRLADGNVPDALKGARVFALDLGGMLAGTQYRGDFEKRFKKVLAEISAEEKPIIYIDEIHNLSGAGAVGESPLDASNMLKPYLSDGKIRFIGATTFEEYKKHFEKNRSLARRFQNVEITEPSRDESVAILMGLKKKYEQFHGVKYSKGVIEYAVDMSSKYINERFLPDKAIDLMDEAGAYRKLHPTDKKTQTVDKAVINEILTNICRVPIETVKTDDSAGLSTLEKRLKSRIFGQDDAIEQVVNAVKFSKAGLLEDNKPLASLLFAGPTGVGKTEIAKSLAEELGIKLVRFDMSEYSEKHAVAKLIGSPAGYVGYEEGGLLTEAIRKNPSAVLLLDEIEKAHPDIYNVLLQVMDYASLTDNQGRKADFRNVIIIMTSNAGASKIGKGSIGFSSTGRDSSVISEEVKRVFQPEFRNRLNKIVIFNGMDDAMASLIVSKKLRELSDQLAAKNITLTADECAVELIKEKGITPEMGAREVDRVIRNDIKPLFVDDILFGKLRKGGVLHLSSRDGSFAVTASKKQGV